MSFQPWHLKLRSHRGDDWVREYPEGSNFTVKNPIPNEEVNTLKGEGGSGMVLGANCQHLFLGRQKKDPKRCLNLGWCNE